MKTWRGTEDGDHADTMTPARARAREAHRPSPIHDFRGDDSIMAAAPVREDDAPWKRAHSILTPATRSPGMSG